MKSWRLKWGMEKRRRKRDGYAGVGLKGKQQSEGGGNMECGE